MYVYICMNVYIYSYQKCIMKKLIAERKNELSMVTELDSQISTLYVYMYACMYLYVCIYAYIYECVYSATVSVFMCVRSYLHLCMYIFVYMRMCAYV